MEKKDILKLFPLKGFITQEIIDSQRSIGQQVLENLFPTLEEDDIFWGLSIGNIKGVLIKTTKKVRNDKGKEIEAPFYLQRTDIKEPQEIIFQLR